jgi:hypothetical protein
MKKLVILSLIMVIVMGSLGVAYSSWSQTLTGNAEVNTGTFKADITFATTDDPNGMGAGSVDPTGRGAYSGGSWTVTRLTDPTYNNYAYMSVSRGQTNEPSGPIDKVNATVYGAYPGYLGTVYFEITNNGDVPMRVTSSSITITPPGGGNANDIAVNLSSNILSGLIINKGATQGVHMYIGIGKDVEQTGGNNPPVTGGTYSVQFTMTAAQYTQ